MSFIGYLGPYYRSFIGILATTVITGYLLKNESNADIFFNQVRPQTNFRTYKLIQDLSTKSVSG